MPEIPDSVIALACVLAVVFCVIEPHLRRRHAELEPTPDRDRLGIDGSRR